MVRDFGSNFPGFIFYAFLFCLDVHGNWKDEMSLISIENKWVILKLQNEIPVEEEASKRST